MSAEEEEEQMQKGYDIVPVKAAIAVGKSPVDDDDFYHLRSPQ